MMPVRSPLPKSSRCLLLLLSCLTLIAGASAVESVDRELVWEGVPGIVAGQYVPGGTQQLLVVSRTGALYWLHEGSGRSARIHEFPVRRGGELGVQALRLHPDYPQDPRLFVLLNPAEPTLKTRLEAWHLRTDGTGQPQLERRETLLSVPQHERWHSGRGLQFGPDGDLYVGLGDGGFSAAAQRQAQDLSSLRGKILRLDVSQRLPGRAYGIPDDNPWVHRAEVRHEIWALGVRQPGGFDFDGMGNLWLADRYGERVEEINRVSAGDNLGWRCFQGHERRMDDQVCRGVVNVPPVFDYRLRGEQGIVGGFLYQGAALPHLQGQYLFADFQVGQLWALTAEGEVAALGRWDWHPSALFPHPNGEPMVADYVGGGIYRLTAAP